MVERDKNTMYVTHLEWYSTNGLLWFFIATFNIDWLRSGPSALKWILPIASLLILVIYSGLCTWALVAKLARKEPDKAA